MLTLRHTKLLIFALGLFSAIALFSSGGQVALARLACRSDPLVVLSDASVMDISADIDTMLWNVEQVHYTLYIPQGLRVVASLSTPNWPTTKEQFTVYATNPAGKFTSTVLVITQDPEIPVTANFSRNLRFLSTDGVSGQELTLTVQR